MIKTYKKTLKNGITLLLAPDKTKNTTYCEFIVKFGGSTRNFIYENQKYNIPFGLAHLLEHNIVENSIYGNAIEYFNKYHVALNAGTTYKETSFYFNTVYDFYDRLEELINIVSKPIFSNKLEQIKNPIYEEIKMKNDRHNNNHIKIINECIYNNDYIDILGSIDTVSKITNKDLNFIHKIFYSPNNSIIALSGNFDMDKVINLINKTYKNKNYNYKILDPKEKYNVNIKEKVSKNEKNDDLITIAFKIPSNTFSKLEKIKLYYYLGIFTKYNFDDNSNNFKEVISNKYSILSFDRAIDKILKNIVVLKISLYTKNENEFKKMVLDTFENIKLDKEYFELEKRMILINIIKNSNNLNYIFNQIVNNYLLFNYFKNISIEFINELNYEECLQLLKKIDFSNYTIIKEIKE